MTTHLLLVDDCPNVTLMLQAVVERFFEPEVTLSAACSLERGLAELAKDMPSAILLDYGLPPYDDCGVPIQSLREAGFEGPIHLWSNHDRATVTSHPAAKDTVGFYQKQDFVGIKLCNLLRDHMCPPQEDGNSAAKSAFTG